MINKASIRAAAYIGVVLVIFFAGFKANGFLWSARYESLEAAHAKAIAEQRERLLSRQDQINDETAEREQALLRELELQRDEYEQLEARIDTTPIIIDRVVQCEETTGDDGPAVAVVDWAVFGRLYDSAATSRPAAETDAADRGDAASGDGTSEAR